MSKLPSNGSMRDAAKSALAEKEETHFPHSHPEYIDPVTGEITTTNPSGAAVSPMEDDDDLLYNPAYAELDVVRQVTCPVFKWQAGTSIVVQITQPLKLGKDLEATTKMKPPHLTIVKFVRGQLRTLIFGTILKEEIEGAYPADGYVGRWFALRKLPREKYMNATTGDMDTKRYSNYQVLEINDPSATLITRESRAPIGTAADSAS